MSTKTKSAALKENGSPGDNILNVLKKALEGKHVEEKEYDDVDIERKGNKIILPEGMSRRNG